MLLVLPITTIFFFSGSDFLDSDPIRIPVCQSKLKKLQSASLIPLTDLRLSQRVSEDWMLLSLFPFNAGGSRAAGKSPLLSSRQVQNTHIIYLHTGSSQVVHNCALKIRVANQSPRIQNILSHKERREEAWPGEQGAASQRHPARRPWGLCTGPALLSPRKFRPARTRNNRKRC